MAQITKQTIKKNKLDSLITKLNKYKKTKENSIKLIEIENNKFKNADVSCIIAAYNSEKFLGHSFKSLLNQDFSGNIEVIISYDNGTVDDTIKELVKLIKTSILPNNYKIKILLDPHLTIFRDKVLSLEVTNGRYLTFLDSDNIIDKDKIKDEFLYLEKGNLDFVFCDLNVIDENGKLLRDKFQKAPKNFGNLKRVLFSNYVDLTSTMLSREFYQQILSKSFNLLKNDFFDDTLEDYLILMIAASLKKVNYLKKTLGSYRIQSQSNTPHINANKKFDERWYLKSAKSTIAVNKSIIAFNYVNSKLHLTNKKIPIVFANQVGPDYNILNINFPSSFKINSLSRLPFRILRLSASALFSGLKLIFIDIFSRFRVK